MPLHMPIHMPLHMPIHMPLHMPIHTCLPWLFGVWWLPLYACLNTCTCTCLYAYLCVCLHACACMLVQMLVRMLMPHTHTRHCTADIQYSWPLYSRHTIPMAIVQPTYNTYGHCTADITVLCHSQHHSRCRSHSLQRHEPQCTVSQFESTF